jgi:hypothetical protein
MKRAAVVLLALSAPVLAASFRPFAGMRGDTVPAWTTPQGSPSTPDPTFDLVAGATTPNDLPDTLTVNSVSMTLVLACDSSSISGTTWTCRNASGPVTLSEAGTGASPIMSPLNPFHAVDPSETSAMFPVTDDGKYYAGSSSLPDLTTDDDLVVELVAKDLAYGSDDIYFGESSGSLVTDSGWRFGTRVTGAPVALTISDGSAFASAQSSNFSNLIFTARNPVWHFFAWIDASDTTTTAGECGGVALNGISISAACSAAPSSVGAPSSSVVPSIDGSSNGGSRAAGANRAYQTIRVWKCAGCLPGGGTNLATMTAAASRRVPIVYGVSPIIARGSAAPTTLTRATLATVDVVDGNTRHLYRYYNNAPRVARRTSQGSPIAGYLSEPAVSNIALQSQTLGTTWAAITVGDNVLADAFAGADLSVTGDNVDGNNSNAEHGLRQSITVSAATHTFSAWAKTGSQNFVALRNNTIANGAAWFNVATCTSSSCTIGEDCAAAVGTVQAGVSRASAERYPIDTTGDGVADENLCRVSITYTGTAAAHNHDLLCAPSNGVLTYTDADATADCGFWGVRVEAFPTPTSYLATTTASTARNADDLRFDGASHYTGSPSTMDVSVLCPSYDIGASLTFGSLGNGASNFARLGAEAANDRPSAEGVATTQQWFILSSSGDACNGVSQVFRQTMETNNVNFYINSVAIGADTAATLPTVTPSFIYIGENSAGSAQPVALISRARLWSSLVAP